jgi:hypothetical protein
MNKRANEKKAPMTEEIFCEKIVNKFPECRYFHDIDKIIEHVKELKGKRTIVSPILTSNERTALLAAMEGNNWTVQIARREECLINEHVPTPYELITLQRK